MGWWRRYLRWRHRNVPSLTVTADGFIMSRGGHATEISWDEVTRIFTFKRDLMTVDLMCLAFETSSGAVEIDEDMAGYREVEADMERRLAIKPDWKLRVMFPAFAPNLEAIFERIPAAQSA